MEKSDQYTYLVTTQALQALELYAEVKHVDLNREQREHVAGTLSLLREGYDDLTKKSIGEFIGHEVPTLVRES